MPGLEIQTPLLRLRPVSKRDLGELHRLWTHPEVRRFLWDGEAIPVEQTRSAVGTSCRLFAERGFGLWVATPREASEIAGFGGFWFFRDPPELELLYGVAAEHWGKGYATDMARALLGYGFASLCFEEIRASTDAANVASLRVLEKLGMAFDRRVVADGLDTVFYRVARDPTHRLLARRGGDE